MSAGDSPLTLEKAAWSSHPLLRVSQLQRLRECEQVAAICYRIRRECVEFLLVRTRRGRWTFPKGGVEPGLTHAQVAALEAFEEAGVHGRMEEASFARYVRHKGKRKSSAGDVTVSAHLCEVFRLGIPKESGRTPTWFSAEQTTQRLRKDRRREDGAELARVVDRAVARIQRLQRAPCLNMPAAGSWPTQGSPRDALQQVPFEASEVARRIPQTSQASLRRYIRCLPGEMAGLGVTSLAIRDSVCKVRQIRGNGNGSTVTALPAVRIIDGPRPTTRNCVTPAQERQRNRRSPTQG